jgi:hypothetical protein
MRRLIPKAWPFVTHCQRHPSEGTSEAVPAPEPPPLLFSVQAGAALGAIPGRCESGSIVHASAEHRWITSAGARLAHVLDGRAG